MRTRQSALHTTPQSPMTETRLPPHTHVQIPRRFRSKELWVRCLAKARAVGAIPWRARGGPVRLPIVRISLDRSISLLIPQRQPVILTQHGVRMVHLCTHKTHRQSTRDAPRPHTVGCGCRRGPACRRGMNDVPRRGGRCVALKNKVARERETYGIKVPSSSHK